MAFNKYLWQSSPVVSGFGVNGLSGDAGKYIRVNATELNLEFVAPTGTGSPVNNISPTISNLNVNTLLKVNGSGLFGNDAGSLAAGIGVRVFYSNVTGAGRIFTYNYDEGSGLPLELGGNTLRLDYNGAATFTSLAGTGTRLTTSTSAGVLGNATTISGAYTWTGTQTLQSTLAVTGASTFTGTVSGGTSYWSGRVGIGTTSPSERLEVRQASVSGSASILIVNEAPAGTQGETAEIRFATANNVVAISKISATRTGNFTSESNRNSDLRFWTSMNGSVTERMRITHGGNVLVNTNTNLGHPLQVNGTAYATRFQSGPGTSNFDALTTSGAISVGTKFTVSTNGDGKFEGTLTSGDTTTGSLLSRGDTSTAVLSGGIFTKLGIAEYTAQSGSSTRWNCIVTRGTNGAPLYVRVGEGGAIESSPDALTWTSRTSGTINMLNFVIYDSYTSKYWVVGASSTMLSSSDGITWSAVSLPVDVATDNLTGIATNGAGNFAVSNTSAGRILVSIDSGATWTIHAVGGATTSMTYDGMYFIAGRYSGTTVLWNYVAASAPTATWVASSNSIAASDLFSVVVSGPNRIYAGSQGVIVTQSVAAAPTSSGLTIRESGTTSSLRLFTANGRVYAVGQNGVSLESSDNGVTWQSGPPVGVTSFLRYGVVDPRNPTRALVVGDNGVTLFGEYPVSYKALDTGSTTRWNYIVPRGQNGAPLYVRVGEGGAIETSPDALTWTSRTSGTANMFNFVIYDSFTAAYWAVGNSGTMRKSADGITWSSVSLPGSVASDNLSSIATDGAGIFIVGNTSSGNRNLQSLDSGATWAINSMAAGNGAFTVHYSGGTFITGRNQSGTNRLITYSSNVPGNQWVSVLIPGGEDIIYSIVNDGVNRIIFGLNGFIATCPAGLPPVAGNWTVRSTGVSSSLRGMVANGRVYAVGGGGISLESTDNGETWQPGPVTGTTNFLRFGVEDTFNQRALVVGDSGTLLAGNFPRGNTNIGPLYVNGPTIIDNTLTVSGNIVAENFNVTSITAGELTVTNTISLTDGNGSIQGYGGGQVYHSINGQNNIVLEENSTNFFQPVSFATSATVEGTLAVTSNFQINTDKFTVDASSGNTLIAGTLNVTGYHVGTTGFFDNFRSPAFYIGTSDQGDAPLLASVGNTVQLSGSLAISGDFDVGGSVSYDSISVSDLQLPDGNGQILGYGGGQVYISINSQNNVVFEETSTNFFQNVTIAGDLTVNGAFNFTTSASSLYVDDDVSADYYVARDTTNGFQFFSGTGVTYDGEGGLLLKCNNNVGLRVNSAGGAFAYSSFSTPTLTVTGSSTTVFHSLRVSAPSTGIEFTNSNTKIATGSGNLFFSNNNITGLVIASTGAVNAPVSLTSPVLESSSLGSTVFFVDAVNEITNIGGRGSGGSIIRTVGSHAGGSLGFFTNSKTSTIQTITETSSDPAVTELQNFLINHNLFIDGR